MKVKNIKIQDLRNIEIVNTDLGDWNIIAGNNGSGKSTIIDAIFGAIVGKKYFKADPVQLIKHGKDRAEIKMTLTDGQKDIIINRTFTDAGEGGKMYLKVETSDGTKLCQADLDNLLSTFTIDPLWFARLAPEKQIDVVKEVAGIDTSEVEKKATAAYEERTIKNREVKRLSGVLDTYDFPNPIEEVDVQDLMKQKEAIKERNDIAKQEVINYNNAERDRVDNENKKIREHNEYQRQLGMKNESFLEKLREKEKLVSEIEEKLKSEKAKLEIMRSDELQLKEPVEQKEELKPELKSIEDIKLESTQEIDIQIQDAFEKNKLAQKYQEYLKYKEEYNKAEDSANEVDEYYNSLLQKRKEIIENSVLPEGIEFNRKNGVLYNDIPFSELNTAEQIKLAIKLGSSLTPEIKVLHIKDGSLIDENTMKEIKDIVEENDYQILIEKVGENEQGAIIMREGVLIN